MISLPVLGFKPITFQIHEEIPNPQSYTTTIKAEKSAFRYQGSKKTSNFSCVRCTFMFASRLAEKRVSGTPGFRQIPSCLLSCSALTKKSRRYCVSGALGPYEFALVILFQMLPCGSPQAVAAESEHLANGKKEEV